MGLYRRGKVYYARWLSAGREQRRSLGTTSRGEAERRLAELLVGRGLRIEQMLKQWLDYKRVRHHSKPRSIEAFEIAARRFTRLWGEAPAENFPESEVEAFKAQRIREVSPETLNNDLNLLRNSFSWARTKGLVSTVPKVEALLMRKKRVPKALSAADARKLLDVVSAGSERLKRLEVVVRLALNTGLRRNEIVWLRWGDIDLTNGWLHVTAKQGWSPKSWAERSVPICEDFAEWLKRYRERKESARLRMGGPPLGPDDWVCSWDDAGSQWNPLHLGQEVKRAYGVAAVAIPNGQPLHGLRSTFAVAVLRGGGDLESLREMLGHADLKTTAVYLHATDESKRNSIKGVQF